MAATTRSELTSKSGCRRTVINRSFEETVFCRNRPLEAIETEAIAEIKRIVRVSENAFADR